MDLTEENEDELLGIEPQATVEQKSKEGSTSKSAGDERSTSAADKINLDLEEEEELLLLSSPPPTVAPVGTDSGSRKRPSQSSAHDDAYVVDLDDELEILEETPTKKSKSPLKLPQKRQGGKPSPRKPPLQDASSVVISDDADSNQDEDIPVDDDDDDEEEEEDFDEEDVVNEEDMESEEEESFATEKINIFHSNGSFFLWNADDVFMLREECRMVGKLAGSLVRAPRQNVHLGLPLQLMPEEARLLVDIDAATVVVEEPVSTQTQRIREASFVNVRQDNFRIQQTLYKENRQDQIDKRMGQIIAGKKAKKKKMKEAGQENREEPTDKRAETAEVEKENGSTAIMGDADISANRSTATGGDTDISPNGSTATGGDTNILATSLKATAGDTDISANRSTAIEGDTDISANKSTTAGGDTDTSGNSLKATGGDSDISANRSTASIGDAAVSAVSAAALVEDSDKKCETEEDLDSLTAKDIPIPETSEKETLVQLFTENPWKRSFRNYLEWKFPVTEKELLRYLVFKDLWGKGFFLTSGSKFGGDFLIYPGDPSRFHSHYIAICKSRQEEIPCLDIIAAGRLASNVRKTALLCSLDRNQRVVYTSLTWTGIS